MTQYIATNDAHQVLWACGRRDPIDYVGEATSPKPTDENGLTFHPWQHRVEFGAPPSPTHELRWNGSAVVWTQTADLPTLKQQLIDAMSAACAQAILAGFTSSALGASYTYPAKMTDQSNLAGSVLESLMPCADDWTTPFWCADADGDWQWRPHTASQIQQVGRDAKAAILACMARNEALRSQIIDEAATAETLSTITWET